MSNPFDQLAGTPYRGYHAHPQLGLNIGKSLKKLGKKIDKKITRPVAKAAKKVAKSPLGKVALVAGAALALGPVVSKVAGAVGSKAGTVKAAGSVAHIGKAVVKSKALPKVAAFAVQQKLSKNAQKKQLALQKQLYNTQNPLNPVTAKGKKIKTKKRKAIPLKKVQSMTPIQRAAALSTELSPQQIANMSPEQQILQLTKTVDIPVSVAPPTQMVANLSASANQTAAIAQQISTDPQFNLVANTMMAQGATPQQVTDAWTSSQQYAQVATPQIANTILPEIRQQLIAQGVPPVQAAQQAELIAQQTASNTVADIQSQARGVPLWVWATGAGGLFLLLTLQRR